MSSLEKNLAMSTISTLSNTLGSYPFVFNVRVFGFLSEKGIKCNIY